MPTPISWLAATQTNTGTAANESQSTPLIIGLSNGNFLVAWVETGTTGVGTNAGTDIIGKIYDAQGNLVADSFRINDVYVIDDEGDFSIAATNDGGFVMVYVDDSIANVNETGIRWERYDSAGTMIHNATIANENVAADFLGNPEVTVNLLTNESYVSYTDDVGANTDINGVIVSATGSVGAEFAMAQNSADSDSEGVIAVLTGGNVVSLYREVDGATTSLEARIVNSAGVLVNIASPTFNTAFDPDIAALSDGNWVAVWTEGDNILYRVYGPTGSAITGALTAAGSAGFENEPAVVGLPQGGFAIVWDNDSTGALEGQLFTNAGAADGSVFTVTGVGTTSIDVGVSADGRLLITWIDQSSGEVFHSIMDPRGATIDGGDFDNASRSFVNNTGPITGNSLSNTITDSIAINGTVIGGNGNDTFIGVDGVTGDTFNGGSGTDTLDNSGVGFSPTVTVNLGAGTVDVSGGGNVETLISIENYIGGGEETIIGSSVANVLTGGSGANTIDGGLGADTINGGDGDDILLDGDAITNGETFNGGAGIDTLDASSTGVLLDTVTVNLGAGTRVVSGGQSETLISIENYIGSTGGSETIIGSGSANVLTGGSGNNIIDGGFGNDTLNGGEGNDLLTGGSGEDTVNGGGGDDTIFFTSGHFFDNINGGAGVDTLDASASNAGLTIDLRAGTLSGFGGATQAVSIERVIGTGLNDTIRSGGNAGGGTFVDAGGGDDLVYAVNGLPETLDGGTGIDTLDTTDFTGNYVIDLTTGLTNFGGELYTNFENLVSGDGNDTLTGTSGANVIDAGEGSDTVFGGGGNDTINGGIGNDILRGEGGTDTVNGGAGDDTVIVGSGHGVDNADGGAGLDTLDYSDTSGTVVFDMVTGAFSYNGLIADAFNFENYNGTSGNDTVTGTGGVNIINGGAGDDVIDSGFGIDEVHGGAGNDRFIENGTNLIVDGGTGSDTADYSGVGGTGIFYWTIASGYRGTTSFAGPVQIAFTDIENFAGFGGNDNVLGNAENNRFDGNDGDDWLRGLTGNDILNGGAGTDILDGGVGADSMSGGLGDDVFYVDNAGDSVTEAVGEGVDEVRTTVNNYTLGANLDNLRLQAGAVNGSGNALNNTIIAGVGPATLNGLGGDDVIFGSGASDTIDGGTDNDSLYGRNGNDNITGGSGDDLIRGEIGSDTLNGGSGNDLIFGDEGIDTLFGGSGDDDLRGGIQNDTLYGEAGADQLRGEDGNDNLYGGAGRDFFTGGAGNDNFYFDDGDFSGITAATADRIVDFAQGSDRIRLNLVDANAAVAGDQAFTFIGTGAFTNVAGQLRYQISGATTLVYGDTNGDGVADFAIALTGATALVAGDFAL